MDVLSSLIVSLNEKQHKGFKKFIGTNAAKKDNKLLKLYELLRANPVMERAVIIKKIYKDVSKIHAYHLLRSRLNKQLEDFIYVAALEDDYLADFIKHVMVARQLDKIMSPLQYRYYEKAEQIAVKNNRYHLLNYLYYTESMRFGFPMFPDVLDLLEKHKANKLLSLQEEEGHYANAIINTYLSNDIKSQSNIDTLEAVVLKKLNAYGLSTINVNDLATIVALANAMQSSYNFALLVDYAAEKLALFEQQPHILIGPLIRAKYQLLYLQALGLLHTASYARFVRVYESLKSLILEDEQAISMFLPRVLYLNIDHLILVDKLKEATQLLDDTMKEYGVNFTEMDYLFGYSAKVHINFMEKKWANTMLHLNNIRQLNIAKDLTVAFTIDLQECYIHFETEDWLLIGNKARAIKRKYKEKIKNDNFSRLLLQFFGKSAKHYQYYKQKEGKAHLKELLTTAPYYSLNHRYVSNYIWLLSKYQVVDYHSLYCAVFQQGIFSSSDKFERYKLANL